MKLYRFGTESSLKPERGPLPIDREFQTPYPEKAAVLIFNLDHTRGFRIVIAGNDNP